MDAITTTDELKVFSSGKDFGLSLVLDIESSYYMRYGLSPSAGVKVIISQPKDMPEVLSSHFIVGKNRPNLLFSP